MSIIGYVLDSPYSSYEFDAALKTFRKPILRAGRFTHPTRGYTLNVTPQSMREIMSNFHTMRQRGYPVPLAARHSLDPRNVVGNVVDLELDRDELVAIVEAETEVSDKMKTGVLKNHSVCITDGLKLTNDDGSLWELKGHVLEHLALSAKPCIASPNERFEPYRSTMQGEVVAMSREDDSEPLTVESLFRRSGYGNSYGGKRPMCAAPQATAIGQPIPDHSDPERSKAVQDALAKYGYLGRARQMQSR